MVPPFEDGISLACRIASIGGSASYVESVCQSVARDAIPIHLAVVLDIGKPGHFRIFGMTILDQRMHAWRAEPTGERGEFGRAKILVAEHKHRVFCEYTPDPGEGHLVERP